MHIVYLANSRFPSERAHMIQMVSMCRAFADMGHKVTLCVTDRVTQDITTNPEKFYNTKCNFTVERLTIPDIVGKIYSSPQFLRPFMYTVQRFFFALQASRFLHKHDVDVIYGRDEWILWLLKLLHRTTRSKLVFESHEGKYNLPVKQLFAQNVPCITISEGVHDAYLAHGIDATRLIVAHDAVDDAFFQEEISKEASRKRLGIREKLPVVMYIGGLQEWKGTEVLFEASSTTSMFATYVIGGTDEQRACYRDRYPMVRFLGKRPYHELASNQRAADVLVVPNTAKNTLSAAYTSPLKIFAHVASGVPMVVANVPSIRNILGSTCVTFFKADDPESLRNAIHQVVTNTERSKQCARSMKEYARQFTWVTRAKRILAFLEKNT